MPKSSDIPPREPRRLLLRRPLLRRLDQAAVAVLVTLALLAIIGYWYTHGGTGLIEVDRAAPQTARFLVDINEADWPELAQLPGVGEIMARRIVSSRETAGPFADHDQLRRVRGIGPRTLDRLRPYLLPIPDSGNVAGQ